MVVYLKNKETNEIISEYTDVTRFGTNFVEMNKNGNRSKLYCNDDEYFVEAEKTDEEKI